MINWECRRNGMSFKGYYNEEADCLCFYNCIGQDIKTRIPANPYNRTKEHRKHKNFEEIKEWIMKNYNLLKITVKENRDKEDYEIESRKMTIRVNKKVEINESEF